MGKSEQLNDIIARLKASTDGQQIKQIYRDWSATYNQDLDYFGYMAPQVGVALFDEVFAQEVRMEAIPKTALTPNPSAARIMGEGSEEQSSRG